VSDTLKFTLMVPRVMVESLARRYGMTYEEAVAILRDGKKLVKP